MLLQLSDVHAGYAGSDVLEGVDLAVPEGSVVTLLGRNGVGKTTTLRTIVGLLSVTAGTIQYDGEDVTGWEPHQAYGSGIGIVTEERDIFPDLTVEENLRVPVVEGGEERSIEEIYEFFPKLEEVRQSMGKHLSGGEQQMLAIARALRRRPRLLLLDEPSEGLAPQIVEDVAEIIKRIAAEETTLLLVEQNVKFALDVASEAYIMDSGRIVYEGTAEAVEAGEADVERFLGVTQAE